jgi:hypothetical protein
MSRAEAKARCAALDIRDWEQPPIDAAIVTATTALIAASPLVTPVAGTPGMWWVGATGFEAVGGEALLAQHLLTIAQRWHPDARVAIADACVTARAATWTPQRAGVSPITIVPVGGCAAYLAPAPLGLVPMEPEMRDALHALGVRTVGTFASLDAGDVERRWGKSGVQAWRLAHGDDARRPATVRVEATRTTRVELPGAVERVEPLLFVLRAQLERLVRGLVEDARAAAAVAITLVLDAGRRWPLGETDTDDTTTVVRDADAVLPDLSSSLLAVPERSITREVRPTRPLARVEPLFDQCRALLERWEIPAPIIGLAVSIPATAPLAADQGDLLIPSWRDAAMHAEAVVARLRAALDPEHRGDVVVRPLQGDAHRPEAAARWVPADPIAQAAAAIPAASDDVATEAVLRLLDAPEAVTVEAPHGVPTAMWWRGVYLAITHADGPERLSGEWWRGDAYARDYWRCEAEGAGTVLLFGEASEASALAWCVQGWYD